MTLEEATKDRESLFAAIRHIACGAADYAGWGYDPEAIGEAVIAHIEKLEARCVVRCGECRHWHNHYGAWGTCQRHDSPTGCNSISEGFGCPHGERRVVEAVTDGSA